MKDEFSGYPGNDEYKAKIYMQSGAVFSYYFEIEEKAIRFSEICFSEGSTEKVTVFRKGQGVIFELTEKAGA